jgi:HlyD family secretion protein
VPLDARSRAEARARVKAAQAALDRARAERGRIREEHALAARELERVRRLAEQGIVAQERLDTAESEARARAEALAAAEAAARNAASELELANARLLEPGAGDGEGGAILNLYSPVDGVVLRRLRQSEAVVPAGEVLLEVADPADLEIVADYLSNDAVRMRPGMRVWIDRWGGGRVLEGRVRRVEPAGFMKVSALGVEEQRVNVLVDFVEPEEAGTLGDAYRVEVRVIVEERNGGLTVPTSSLFRRDEQWMLFSVKGGRARLRPVGIGVRNALEAEILDGVVEGETVIVHPSEQVADGVRVSERGA